MRSGLEEKMVLKLKIFLSLLELFQSSKLTRDDFFMLLNRIPKEEME